MFFSDKITIRAVVSGVDANGYGTQTEYDTEVGMSSATRAEFYRPMQTEFDVTQMFEVHAVGGLGQSNAGCLWHKSV